VSRIDSGNEMNDISRPGEGRHGTNEAQSIEAKRPEIIGSYGRRSCARKLDELGPSAGAGAERCKAARKFYRAGSEPTLEFGRAICYGAAEGAADPAD